MSFRTQLAAYLGTAWHVRAKEIQELMSLAVDGTVEASKPIVADANKDITGGRNITISGTMVANQMAATTSRNDTLTAASTINANVQGTTFYIVNATGFQTVLPSPFAGARFTFINALANTSGNHTIVTGGSSNVIKGNQNSVAGDAGDFGTADDTISFVANQSLAGDKVELYSDGTSWFAYAISKVAAGITFTQAS